MSTKEKAFFDPRRDYEDITTCDIKREKQELVPNCDRLDRLKPELSNEEFENLKSQFVISSSGTRHLSAETRNPLGTCPYYALQLCSQLFAQPHTMGRSRHAGGFSAQTRDLTDDHSRISRSTISISSTMPNGLDGTTFASLPT